MRFVDVHHHLVYGIDDGPRELEDSLDMLRLAQSQNVSHIVATSHAYAGMQAFPLERYVRHLNQVRQAARENGIDITIFSGCEIFYSEAAVRLVGEGQIPTLAGTNVVLVEFDPTSSFDQISEAVRKFSNRRYQVIVAHCERYDALYGRIDEIREMAEAFPVHFQMNASTIVSRLPWKARRFRDEMLSEGLIFCVGSDAHNCQSRRIRLKEAYQTLGEEYGKPFAVRLLARNVVELLRAAPRLV